MHSCHHQQRAHGPAHMVALGAALHTGVVPAPLPHVDICCRVPSHQRQHTCPEFGRKGTSHPLRTTACVQIERDRVTHHRVACHDIPMHTHRTTPPSLVHTLAKGQREQHIPGNLLCTQLESALCQVCMHCSNRVRSEVRAYSTRDALTPTHL